MLVSYLRIDSLNEIQSTYNNKKLTKTNNNNIIIIIIIIINKKKQNLKRLLIVFNRVSFHNLRKQPNNISLIFFDDLEIPSIDLLIELIGV